MSFNCRNRLLLTGTPIQNTMAEVNLHYICPFYNHDLFYSYSLCVYICYLSVSVCLCFCVISCGLSFISSCLPCLIPMKSSVNGSLKTQRITLKGNLLQMKVSILLSLCHCSSLSSSFTDQLSRLHMILKPFMLRRIKKDVEHEMAEKVCVCLCVSV